MPTDTAENDVDHDIALMARGAAHLLEQVASIETANPALQNDIPVLREALTGIGVYLASVTDGALPLEEKQRARARGVKMFEGVRDYLDKLGLSLAIAPGGSCH